MFLAARENRRGRHFPPRMGEKCALDAFARSRDPKSSLTPARHSDVWRLDLPAAAPRRGARVDNGRP
jgi:hypothetical protein